MKSWAKMLATVLMIGMLAGCGKEKVPVYTDWEIYEKTYIPATSGTSGRWGYSFADDGGFVYIPGSSGTAAKYEFFLKREENGAIKTCTVYITQEEFASYEKGDTYTVKTYEWVEKRDRERNGQLAIGSGGAE